MPRCSPVAVHGLTNRDGGRVLQPDDVCIKSGRRVLEVLQDKHLAMRDLGTVSHKSTPDAMPLNIMATDVEKISSELSGSAGSSGVDAVDLRNWLLRFGAASEALRAELVLLANLLANEHPPWVSYRTLMA